MTIEVAHSVIIMTIVDRCDFDKVLECLAFTNRAQAMSYGERRCEALLMESKEDLFDPSYSTQEVFFA